MIIARGRGAIAILVVFGMFGMAGRLAAQEAGAAGPQAGQAPATGRRAAPPSASEERIRAALVEPTSVDFVNTPLADVVDFLRDMHKINIRINRKALVEAGLLVPDDLPPGENAPKAVEMPVSVKLYDVRLESVLDLILAEHDLTWVIAHEVLLITTPRDASARYELRSYDIADLLDATAYPEQLADVLRTAVTRPTEVAATGTPLGVTSGRSITTYRNLLIVRDTSRSHEQIEWLLSEMRANLPVTPQ
jgi:hypothetical protein